MDEQNSEEQVRWLARRTNLLHLHVEAAGEQVSQISMRARRSASLTLRISQLDLLVVRSAGSLATTHHEWDRLEQVEDKSE